MNANSLKERYRILEAEVTDATPPEKNPKEKAKEELEKLLEGLKAALVKAGDAVQAEGKAEDLLQKLNLDSLYGELAKPENISSEENNAKILNTFGLAQAAAPAPEASETREAPAAEPPATGGKPAGDDATPQTNDGTGQPSRGNEAGDGAAPGRQGGPSGGNQAGGGARGGSAPQIVTGQPIQVLGTEATPERGRVSGRKTSIQVNADLAVQLIDNPEFKKLISSGNADMHLAWDDDRLIAPLIGN